ncbi:MAG: hypothetical protein K2H52_11355 [Lachnospiraceae bacterium]|nr:hypothetical protein [Lachnospiraceae bacterium]
MALTSRAVLKPETGATQGVTGAILSGVLALPSRPALNACLWRQDTTSASFYTTLPSKL